MLIPERFSKGWRKAVLLAYWLALFTATSIPGTWLGWTHPAAGSDKLAHGLAFAVLSFLLCWSRADSGRQNRLGLALSSIGIAAVYGIFDELHQRFIPMRAMDPADMLADAIGAALGTCLWAIVALLFGRGDGTTSKGPKAE